MHSTASIADQLAIRAAVDNFNIGVMRKDAEIWGACWAEEGRWAIDLLDEPAQGRAAVVAVFQSIMERIDFASITSSVTHIAVDGETARAQCYNQELLYTGEGAPKLLVGCFHDRLVLRNGQWLFTERVYESLKRGPLIP